MNTLNKFAVACIAMGVGLASAAVSAGTLDQVKQRGILRCGSNVGIAGFGNADNNGQWRGFDVDYCRAIASAIFNDPKKVEFIPLTSKNALPTLQSGEVDVLIRNVTWTMSRDTVQGLMFTGVNFYDGQGFMVRKKMNVTDPKQLSGASVCVQQGTTTEMNLADFFRDNNLKYDVVTFASSSEAVKAYDSGRCDAFTTETTVLNSELHRLTNSDEHEVLSQVISKEPFSPVVRQGDDQWFGLVKWTGFALINAEELGISQKTLPAMLDSKNPSVRRLLGKEGEFGQGLGLTNDWAERIIRHVGNFGEVFERNLGQNSELKIKRGLNALWTNGGLMYAPPIR
jgi:general L-amino acid transport system substrate-binding protein